MPAADPRSCLGKGPARVQKVDAIVLGAGIVGVSTAIHLQLRGHRTLLVDRQEPGEGTTYGNAGIIEREGFLPPVLPKRRGLPFLASGGARFNCHGRTWRRQKGWRGQFQDHCTEQATDGFARTINEFQRHAVAEHRFLSRLIGVERFYRNSGRLQLFRSKKEKDVAEQHLHYARIFGADYDELSPAEATDLEPDLKPNFLRAIYWKDSQSVSDPGTVTKIFVEYFRGNGGEFSIGNATTLERRDTLWTVSTAEGRVAASHVVIALGPWSDDLLNQLGYLYPFCHFRGYHIHYRPSGNAGLRRPVLDADNRFVLSPTVKGIRLSTGIEFADRDAPPTPLQVERARPLARSLFPIAEKAEAEPWMGSRMVLPDALPLVGPAPNHGGLWLNLGHGNFGFGSGPVTGRILAEMMNSELPLFDPARLSPDRFDVDLPF